jgi:hypothetical protein
MKRRHEFYPEEDLCIRLSTMAEKPGSSNTAIMTYALRAYFDRGAPSELDELFKTRLHKLSIQLGRIERGRRRLVKVRSLQRLLESAAESVAPIRPSREAMWSSLATRISMWRRTSPTRP